MITNVLINGVTINDNKNIYIARVGTPTPTVEIDTYTRGGMFGQNVAKPILRGFNIKLEFFITGDNQAEILTNKDKIYRYLKTSPILDDTYLVTLGFKMIDGTTRQVDSVFTQVLADVTPQNLNGVLVKTTAITEKEYLESSVTQTATIKQSNYGGMTVPMDLPMDMNVNPTINENILTNNGNAPSYPTVRVYGDLTNGFNLINNTTSKTLSYSETLASGDYIDLDFYNRVAIKNGITNVIDKISGDWWYLDSGTNEIKITTTSGSGYAELSFKDAYFGF